MNVIIDVNVLLAALIKDSATRKIILESGHTFYFPEISLIKLEKYEAYILKKSGLQKNEYKTIINKLMKYIKLLPTEQLIKQWDNARKIMINIDKEDTIFIAAAMNIKDAVIWSEDKHFGKQQRIKILRTADLIKN